MAKSGPSCIYREGALELATPPELKNICGAFCSAEWQTDVAETL